MINFERHLDPKEALGVGENNWLDYRIHEAIKINSESDKAPIIIEKVVISKIKNIEIYFHYAPNKDNLQEAELYIKGLLQKVHIGHLFQNFDFDFNRSYNPEIKFLECSVNPIYKNALKEGYEYH